MGAAVQIAAAENDRAQPQPLDLLGAQAAAPEYTIDALGSLTAGAVRAAMAKAYVPASLAAQSALAAASLAVQGQFDIMLPIGSARPTSLFLVTSAESSDRKSTSDAFLLTAITEFEKDRRQESAGKTEEARVRQKAWDEAMKATTQANKNSGPEALEDAYRALGPKPPNAEAPSIRVSPNSIQGLLRFYESCRASLGFMSDEGGAWLGGYGMKDETRLEQIAILSRFWDGETQQRLTAGEGFVSLPGKRLALHMMIQPVLAPLLLGSAQAKGQGFLNRLLVVQPESLAGSRFVNPNDYYPIEHQRAMDSFNDRIGRAIRAPLPVDQRDGALTPKRVTMSEDATALWWEFYNSLEGRVGPSGDLHSIKGYVGKVPEMAARIATVLAGLEEGTRLDQIDAAQLARGVALAEFYMLEALRLFGKAAPNQQMVEAKLLSDFLRNDWDEDFITVSALCRRAPNSLRNGGEYIQGLVDILCRNEHLMPPQAGVLVEGKRVRRAYRIVRP